MYRRFREWERDGFRVFHAGPYPFGANAFRSVENFIDATHFPFVHAGLNGVMASPDRINDYKVTKAADGLATTGIRVHQPYGDHRQVPVDAEYSLPRAAADHRIFRQAREDHRSREGPSRHGQ